MIKGQLLYQHIRVSVMHVQVGVFLSQTFNRYISWYIYIYMTLTLQVQLRMNGETIASTWEDNREDLDDSATQVWERCRRGLPGRQEGKGASHRGFGLKRGSWVIVTICIILTNTSFYFVEYLDTMLYISGKKTMLLVTLFCATCVHQVVMLRLKRGCQVYMEIMAGRKISGSLPHQNIFSGYLVYPTAEES